VRDQNTLDKSLRQKRLMTLMHLFLVHRYKIDSVHYLSPSEDNQYQTAKMKTHGIFSAVNNEIGEIIVADANHPRIEELMAPDGVALQKLIRKQA
jgi:isocitrate lyase